MKMCLSSGRETEILFGVALSHASALVNPGQSGSDPDCYPGQWVIRVSSSDPVSTLE